MRTAPRRRGRSERSPEPNGSCHGVQSKLRAIKRSVPSVTLKKSLIGLVAERPPGIGRFRDCAILRLLHLLLRKPSTQETHPLPNDRWQFLYDGDDVPTEPRMYYRPDGKPCKKILQTKCGMFVSGNMAMTGRLWHGEQKAGLAAERNLREWLKWEPGNQSTGIAGFHRGANASYARRTVPDWSHRRSDDRSGERLSRDRATRPRTARHAPEGRRGAPWVRPAATRGRQVRTPRGSARLCS